MLDIGGKSWRLRVVDPLNGAMDERAQLTVTEMEQGIVRTEHDVTARLPKRLVLGDICFDVGFEFQSTDQQLVVKVRLKEISLPMGELAIQGKFIRKLLLRSGDLLAVLDHPSSTVRVPVGDYAVERVALETLTGFDGRNNDLKADPDSGLTAEGKTNVRVEEGQQAVLKIGGPLRNTVNITRSGNAFAAAYSLLGAGGEEYLYTARCHRGVELDVSLAGVKVASKQLPYG
jgi:hypothetical protein